ncbi:MAG: type IV toxin-antitoxin system AbiEi family antitoxin domain-containing protein [Minisyncoccia bacterium]
MQKNKHIQKIREFIQKTPVFTSRDIQRIVKEKNYAYLILNKLTKQKEIFRITKSFYSKFDDPILSVFCFKPAYLGLYEALSLYNFWEQETNVVIITTKKVRQGIRKILDSNVIIKRLKSKYFFGFDYLKYYNLYLPVSDLEKTLIDFIYFKETLPSSLLQNFKSKIDSKKLQDYLQKYPKNFQKIFKSKIKL